MAANGISTMTYKRDRQDAKLEIAEAKRQGKTVTEGSGTYSISGPVDSSANSYRTANTLDASLLPTRYAASNNDTNDVVDNPGSPTAGRPWT